MHAVLEFLLRYGYWILFLNVFAEQVGIPIPCVPVLLAMGALAGLGNFSLALSLLLAVCATTLSDLMWYHLGRTRGSSILNLLCRISLEPDSCVSSTKRFFAKYEAYALLFAKFVPGLGATAPPLAGLTRMPLSRFVFADTVGSIVWAGAYLSTGYIFRNQLERVAESASRMGAWLVGILVTALVSYVGWKYFQRQRFIRGLRVARVSPDELRGMLEAESGIAIVDLRNALELEYEGVKLPGAIHIDLQDLAARHGEIPRDKEIILYCS
jgi:membrane protein DedA with SNARE-associated domain